MTKKRLAFILLIVALIGFAIYEEELEAQWDRQYIMESNVEAWNHVPVSIKGVVDYNHLRIGMPSFEGTVTLGEIGLDYEHDSSFDRIEFWCPDWEHPQYDMHFQEDFVYGNRIAKTLGEDFLRCSYDPDTCEFYLCNSDWDEEREEIVTRWYRLVLTEETT